jgi:cytochrome bd-I ubiquinol oxidase subunit X
LRGASDQQEHVMWYFSWILGVGVALAFGIINVMWFETRRSTSAPTTKR